jgi:hypothetical protein
MPNISVKIIPLTILTRDILIPVSSNEHTGERRQNERKQTENVHCSVTVLSTYVLEFLTCALCDKYTMQFLFS